MNTTLQQSPVFVLKATTPPCNLLPILYSISKIGEITDKTFFAEYGIYSFAMCVIWTYLDLCPVQLFMSWLNTLCWQIEIQSYLIILHSTGRSKERLWVLTKRPKMFSATSTFPPCTWPWPVRGPSNGIRWLNTIFLRTLSFSVWRRGPNIFVSKYG